MSIPVAHLPFFRTEWATRLTDTCVVSRSTPGALNTTTGEYTPSLAEQYSGPCLVRPAAPGSVEAGEEQVETFDYIVFVPYTEVDPLPDDIVVITSATDTFLTGKQLVVQSISGDTYVTVRRLFCVEEVNG